MTEANAEAVANAVLATFDALPAKFKPRIRDSTAREWVPLSGLVLASSTQPFSCVSLATGMKCLPRDKIRLANGVTLHDSHAEILALRAFNCFLIQECRRIATGGQSDWVEMNATAIDDQPTAGSPFRIRDDVRISMYCSEAPCGDASMELIMAQQQDATPWDLPPAPDAAEGIAEATTIHGRGYFSQLGIVRTKPSRPDAPPTLSKSCTDKLALKQCISVLNSVAALLLTPDNAYIDMLVIPESQYVRSATDRAFGPTGRFVHLTEEVKSAWGAGYRYRPFSIATTSREFVHSKRSGLGEAEHIASNISAICTPYVQEVLINGAMQGRKQFDLRGASSLSRRSMWKAATEVIHLCNLDRETGGAWQNMAYRDLKDSEGLRLRGKVKEDVQNTILRPWVRNDGDEAFSLDTLNIY